MGTNTTNKVSKKINDFIRESKKQGHLRPITADHLITKEPHTAKFYTLPKIHKQGTPGRPIISANNCPTEKISRYVNHFLEPCPKLCEGHDIFTRKIVQNSWLVANIHTSHGRCKCSVHFNPAWQGNKCHHGGTLHQIHPFPPIETLTWHIEQ